MQISAWSSGQPSNAILNLRGSVELMRWRSRYRVIASAYGVTSNALVGRDAGVRARRDVAHRIAARFARRHPRVGQQSHRRFDVVQLDEVELNVLARGDVTETARIPLADLGQRSELVGRQQTLRNLDAQHLRVLGLALPVGAANQAKGAPLVRRDLAALVLFERGDELVDVRLVWRTTAARGRRLFCSSTVDMCLPSQARRHLNVSRPTRRRGR